MTLKFRGTSSKAQADSKTCANMPSPLTHAEFDAMLQECHEAEEWMLNHLRSKKTADKPAATIAVEAKIHPTR